MSIKLFKIVSLAVFVGICSTGFTQALTFHNGFAHNDYKHKRPLFEAIESGYTNIETDIHLHKKKLIVSHFSPFLKKKKSLENFYFKPLAAYVKKHEHELAENLKTPIILMIDIKSSANATYKALKPLLEKYSSILTVSEEGNLIPGKVTVVLSGHKPYNLIQKEKRHLAFIDADFSAVSKVSSTNSLYPITSCKYSKIIKWKGKGEIPVHEREKLKSLVTLAHAQGKKVRLWASPENPVVWKELLACGIDFINTDKLITLKNFLLAFRWSEYNANIVENSLL